MDYTAHEILQARILEWVAFPFSRGFFPAQGSNPGLSPALQADSLPAEPQQKPKNTGVGSLSLLYKLSASNFLYRSLRIPHGAILISQGPLAPTCEKLGLLWRERGRGLEQWFTCVKEDKPRAWCGL